MCLHVARATAGAVTALVAAGWLPTATLAAARQSRAREPLNLQAILQEKELSMPVILWLLGVPLVVVILLMLLHVI